MGKLFLIATPIGNLKDISIRAVELFTNLDFLLCEDTSRTGLLLKELLNEETKKPKLISFYDEVESIKTPLVIDLLQKGNNIGLVSNSGTPLISDPGYKLVKMCLKRNIEVVSLPGSTAFVSALIQSGLPANSFWFFGFLPSVRTKRLTQLRVIQENLLVYSKKLPSPSLIFYESPHRLKTVIDDIYQIFGDIEIVLARELTKIYEKVESKKASEWIDVLGKNMPRGEYVVLFKP